MSKFIPRRRRQASIFLPLLLITAGILILVYNLGTGDADFWSTILRLWPLLFIFGGLEGLVRNRKAASNMFGIVLGLALLLSNFDRISWSAWEIIFTFWPVFLVAIGIDLLFSQETVWQQVIAGMLVIAIMGVLALLFDSGFLARPAELSEFKQEIGDVDRATISLNPSLSQLRLHAQGNSDLLVDGSVRQWAGERTEEGYEVEQDTGAYVLGSSGMVFLYEPGVRNRAEWDIGLSSRVPLTIEVNQVVGNQDYDLTGLEVEGFSSSLVIGKSKLILPGSLSFDGRLNLVIGEIEIEVPKGVGFQLVGKPVLGNVRAPESYLAGENSYESPEFEQNEYQIVLVVEHVIGQVMIRQR